MSTDDLRAKGMAGWARVASELIYDGWPIVRLRRDRLRSQKDAAVILNYYIIEAGRWMNVVPITPEGDVVMVRQFRYGAGETTLEVPAGFVERDETPRDAAIRELREETGYEGASVEEIGTTSPNPALQDNTLHTFVARNVVRVAAQSLDPGESIEVVLVPLAEIPERVRSGEIRHALVLAAFAHLLGFGRP